MAGIHLASFVCLTSVGTASLMDVDSRATPVGTVIKLLEDLQTEIEGEGKKEAKSYKKYGCFCKEKTEGKSKSIKEEQDIIDERTATIEEKTKEKELKDKELMQRKQKQEKLAAELDEETKRCKKKKLEYEAEAADLSKALSSLKKAIKALKDSKGAAFLQVDRNDLQQALGLADALGLLEPAHKKAAGVLLQVRVDPDDPEYKFHSDELIALLEKLEKEFRKNKDDLDSEWEDTKKACDEKKKSLKEKMDSNEDAMDTLKEDIGTLKKDIAKAKDELEEAEGTLSDESLYLKDLVTQCQATAAEYDQRTSMRFEELGALKKATKIIKEEVKDADKDANARALLLAKRTALMAYRVVVRNNTTATALLAKHAASNNSSSSALPAKHAASKKSSKPVSFLQAAATRSHAGTFLKRISKLATSDQDRQAKAQQLLHAEGLRLKSSSLAAVAEQLRGNPFVKIQKLIQNLIERLLKEGKNEATKQGFCDEELGKAYKERDTRFNRVRVLNAEIGQLRTSKDTLEDEIDELTEDLKQLNKDLEETITMREEEHDENAETVKTAKGGLEAVTKALEILKEFYKTAAKAKFMQTAASPVDEDTKGPSFSGKNSGKQDQAKGILGMLEVILSDFDRTIRHTTQAEKEAAAEFVEFERTTKSEIAGKETKQELQEQELEATEKSLKKKREDLKDEQGLLDDVLKSVEELKPVCLDSGMSYKERVEKREEEMEALKKALCILDPEGVESECK